MRMPNGYGSIINLGAGRRKPYAIRTTYYVKNPDTGKKKQKFKYIGYYEKSKDAVIALANYNSGIKIKEHVSISDQPSFEEMYSDWINHKCSKNSKPSDSTLRNYKLAFAWCSALHGKKFANLRISDIQEVADEYKGKSESTVGMIKTVLNQMYQYAIKKEIVEKNYAALADWEWIESEGTSHTPFTDDEIKKLWDNADMEDVDLILMMIYTGFRASEFIGLENLNVHLEEKYVIGGMKTDAGTDRTVALNDKIFPLFKARYNKKRYLVLNNKNTKFTYGMFYADTWTRIMKQMGMEHHSPHDTRHTFASLLDRAGANKVCIKLLMGHSIQDITDGVYTHKTIDDLLLAVNLI